jgi:hypothetical protein
MEAQPLYTRDFESIRDRFVGLGIPVEAPGFYDHPAFLALKAQDPDALALYARFVQLQPYTAEYLDFAEKKIRALGDLLYEELVLDGRLGACIDLSMAMSRMLDKLGVWNYMVNGAVTTVYPAESGIPNGYYWPIHDRDDVQAGHAWVCAPPFAVVDVTIGRQPRDLHPHEFVPDFVYAKERHDFPVYIDDLCSEDVRAALVARGVPPTLEGLFTVHSRLKSFLETFQGTLVSHHGALYEYIPVFILESVGRLEHITDLCLNGKYAQEIWAEKVAPRLA